MKTGAVILAAGRLAPTGGLSPREKLGGVAAVHRIILTFQQAGVDMIAVVTGEQGKALERETAKYNCIFLNNPHYETTQMLDSAKIGIRYLLKACGQILITPTDVPLFTAGTVRCLLKSQGFASIPLYQGMEGHPILLSREAAACVLAYEGAGGMRWALREREGELRFPEVTDAGALYEGDDGRLQGKLLAKHNAQLLRPIVHVSLAREDIFFDARTALLLQLVLCSGSVRIACTQLGISYSKGWKMLNLLEEQLGIPVIVRHPGGKNGGYTLVSPEGKAFLERYETMVRRLREAGQAIYRDAFEGFFDGSMETKK